jgi:hypothetical protein
MTAQKPLLAAKRISLCGRQFYSQKSLSIFEEVVARLGYEQGWRLSF